MSCPVMENPQTGQKASGTVKANGENKPAPGIYIKWYAQMSCDERDNAKKYTRDAEGVETEHPEEKQKIKEVSDQFNRFQINNFNEHHHCLRGTHLKTQGVSLPSLQWCARN